MLYVDYESRGIVGAALPQTLRSRRRFYRRCMCGGFLFDFKGVGMGTERCDFAGHS